MKSALLKFVFLFIATSSICGICSKEDTGSDENSDSNNTAVEPDLKPDATWLYLDDAPSLVYSYPTNKRPRDQKWVATKIEPSFSGLNTTTNKRYMAWAFENTGNTRFLSNTLNPGGKERLSVFINEIAATPGAGSYTDFNCWYDVYNSSGTKYDSTKTTAPLKSSAVNITKVVFFQSMGATVDRYKMSGTATFNIMHWPGDIYTLQCHFNNVFVDFLK